MAKVSANYEVVFVVDPAQGEEAVAAQVNNFKTLIEQNASNVEVEEWGTRKLAYPINYKTEGYYVLMYIKAPSELPRELERNLQIADSVLRYLVVRYEGEVPAKREPLKPYVARETVEAPAVEAPVAEIIDDERPVSEAE